MTKQQSTKAINHYDELFTLFYDEVLIDFLKEVEVNNVSSLEFDFTKEDDLRRFFINEVGLLNSSEFDFINLINFTKEFLVFHFGLLVFPKDKWKLNMLYENAAIIVQHFYNVMDDIEKPLNSYYTPNPENAINETSFYQNAN